MKKSYYDIPANLRGNAWKALADRMPEIVAEIKRNQYTPDAELTAISEAAQAAMIEACDQYAKAKEDCIKAILRQVLKREPFLEDAKRLVLEKHPIRFGDPVTTSIYFDNVYLGIMTETTDEIKFMPETKPEL